MSDLRARLLAEIERRGVIAETAVWAHEHADHDTWSDLMRFRALHDPADALRRYAADREALEAANRLESYATYLEETPGVPAMSPAALRNEARWVRRRIAEALGVEVEEIPS